MTPNSELYLIIITFNDIQSNLEEKQRSEIEENLLKMNENISEFDF